MSTLGRPYSVLEAARREQAEAAQTSDLGERLARLESQIMLIHKILEELVRPIREQREAAERNTIIIPEGASQNEIHAAMQSWIAKDLEREYGQTLGKVTSVTLNPQREADLFAPRGTQWDKSAGLDEREIDDLDVPFPTHDDEGAF